MEQTLGTRPGEADAGGQDKTTQAKEQAQEKAGQVADKAREGAGQAREKVREQVDQRSTQAGEQVSSAAGDARSMAEELRKQGKDTPARYAEQAADRAERVGGYLKDADGDTILRDVEDFARKNPWAAVAGGVALGFTVSRLLKASSSERYQRSVGQQGQLPSRSSGVGNGSGAGAGVAVPAPAVPGVPEGGAQARTAR
jgi:ElaB/YqjD/DUF883 family membrane-anchored ribosome-binding protein